MNAGAAHVPRARAREPGKEIILAHDTRIPMNIKKASAERRPSASNPGPPSGASPRAQGRFMRWAERMNTRFWHALARAAGDAHPMRGLAGLVFRGLRVRSEERRVGKERSGG